MKLYLQQNKLARELNAIKPLDINVNLPEDLQELKYQFDNWKIFTSKAVLSFIHKQGEEFIIDEQAVQETINRFTEQNRTYAETNEQKLRFEICSKVKDATEQAVILAGLDFKFNTQHLHKFKHPFIKWASFPSYRWELNIDYILTGRM